MLLWSVLRILWRVGSYNRIWSFCRTGPNPSGSACTKPTRVSLLRPQTVLKFRPYGTTITSIFVSGEWLWIDNSIVDYTNWKNGMPKSDTCVDIDSDSGQWNTNNCNRYRSYICKTPKGMFHELLHHFNLTHDLLKVSNSYIFFSH